MAILYVYKVNDPNNVGPYPPSVMGSIWFENLRKEVQLNSIGGSGSTNAFVFSNATELNAWISAHTLSDSGLLADVASWKSAHGVSYSHQYFDLSADGGTFTPFIS